MDARQRLVFDDAVRQAVAGDLDGLMAEIVALRRELASVERVVGLPGAPLPQRERRVKVAELRAAGHSTRAIAHLTGAARRTVEADLEALGVPRPSMVLGLDGRVTRGPRPAG